MVNLKRKFGLTRHHRKAKSLKGTSDPKNISYVDEQKHRAWHCLFREGKPEYVVEQINKVWIDPDYVVTVTKRRVLCGTDQLLLFPS